MNNQEAKAMLGTEFKYIFETGDSIKGYVKAFDPKVGLTCVSLGLVKSSGKELFGITKTERKDDECCLIGIDFKRTSLVEALDRLKVIKETGEYKVIATGNFGSPSCSF